MRDMVETSSGFGVGSGAADVQAGRVPCGGELAIRGKSGHSRGGGRGDAGAQSNQSVSSDRPVLWRLQGFDHDGNCYGFETTRTGDRSRVVINGKAALELPRAVWNALIDAAALQRAAPPEPRAPAALDDTTAGARFVSVGLTGGGSMPSHEQRFGQDGRLS